MESYDLIVIGAGSAGVRCARVAAQLGAKVAIVESRYLGGTCVNVGCVPKKMLVYAAHYAEAIHSAQGYGWSADNQGLDWPRLLARKDAEISRLNQIYAGLLDKAGATRYTGHGKILAPRRVAVDDVELQCRHIVIATGAWPKIGDYPGAELAITSNEFFHMAELPRRVLIEGGGYIAVELAGILNGLGCTTELVYRGPLFLRGFDDEMRTFLAEQMRLKGVHLTFNEQIAELRQNSNQTLNVHLQSGATRVVDKVITAIGRRPMTDHLGLENTAVCTNADGTLQVNDRFETHEPGIFALGDVVGRLPLTPVAIKEGAWLAHYLYDGDKRGVSYDNVPTAVFSQPEMASVGLTEQQAREQYDEIVTYRSNFRPLQHSLSGLPERTLMKLVVDQNTQTVLGCHMVGEHAAEVMQGMAIAVNMGAKKSDFDRTLGIHPSSAEEFVTMK